MATAAKKKVAKKKAAKKKVAKKARDRSPSSRRTTPATKAKTTSKRGSGSTKKKAGALTVRRGPAKTTALTKTGPVEVSSSMLPRTQFAREQQTILAAPLVLDNDLEHGRVREVEILPHGILYMPWVHVERRYNAAFGVGGWRFVPTSDVKVEPSGRADSVLHQAWAFEVHYKAGWSRVAEATGKHKYRSANPQIDRGDAVEAAKSNALKKCGKSLGVGLELRLKPWLREVREKYCVAVIAPVTRRKKERGQWVSVVEDKVQWRFRTDETFEGEKGEAPPDQQRVVKDDRTIIDVEPIRRPEPTDVIEPEVLGPEGAQPPPPATDGDDTFVFTRMQLKKHGTNQRGPWQLHEVEGRMIGSNEPAKWGYFTKDIKEVVPIQRLIDSGAAVIVEYENTDHGPRMNAFNPVVPQE